jgi:hypothetical protein
MSIEAMKQALEALEKTHTQPGCEQWLAERRASVALRTIIAEAEKQEPVAWLVEFENGEQELQFDKQSVGETQAPLYTTPPAQPAPVQPVEMSPEFTDTARAALLWVLWHHQGGGSPVGQPIRFALGMDAYERLNPKQIAEAKSWAAQKGSTTADFHTTPPAASVSGYTKKIEGLIQERDDARATRDFYMRRVDTLQQWQSKMRDPERTIVCDILANGHTLEPAAAGDRYTTPPAAQPAPVQEPVACRTLCELCIKRGYNFCANAAKTTPITTPPAAQRKPLSFNEVTAIEEKVYMKTTHKGRPAFEYAQALIRATEAAHGIKENT